jgi:IS30 family transposase
MPYRHVSKEERQDIAFMREIGRTQRQMAEALGRSESTISREIRRNSRNGRYWPHSAHEAAMARRRRPRRTAKLEDKKLWKQVERKLQKYWAPEQIAASLGWVVCFQTIYNHLHRRKLYQYKPFLRRGFRPYRNKKKGRRQYERIRDPRPISERAKVVARRRRFGDWECDTLYGPGRKSNVVVCVERRARYVVLIRLNSQKAKKLNRAVIRALRRCGLPVKTLTVDRGMEFSMHKELEQQLKIKVYFADPHCAWQKGTVENTIGLLRQFFPKGMDLRSVGQRYLNKVAGLLNNRPRKVLGFQAPAEAMALA